LEFDKDTVRRWFKELGAAKKARRIKPSLSDAQKRRRIDYICDQVDETTGEYLDQYNVVHLDESWFYLMKEKDKVPSVPRRGSPGGPPRSAQEPPSEDHDHCGKRSSGPCP
ncbi:unnamed protein product, partial [Pylaiella littoralis]